MDRSKADHARSFNSVMPPVNHEWAAKVLNMRVNPKKGPDLIDDNKVVELKFNLVKLNQYNHISWRVLEDQMGYEEDQLAYWGLGKYILERDVENIKTNNPKRLEKMVKARELYLVEWDWMKQFQSYHQKGETERSKWDHKIRFPKEHALPSVIAQYKVEKGIVYLTEGVEPSDFQIQEAV